MSLSLIDSNGLLTTVFGGLLVALFSAIVAKFFKNMKKRKEWETWCQNEIKRVLNPIGPGFLEPILSNNFIPTMGQMQCPEEHEDYNDRFRLVDYIIGQVKGSGSLRKTRFAILGGSGMGKSTFVASFIYDYYNKYCKKNVPYVIKLISLRDEKCKQKIEYISDSTDAYKTILILEGLDENLEAQSNVTDFVNFINKTTQNIKHIILTSRTQLFATSQDCSKYVGIPDANIPLKYEWVYLSPFTDTDIQVYLSSKYCVGTTEYQKAISVTNKCKDLLSRAMILHFVDDLLDLADRDSITTFDVYKSIVDKWLCRELIIDTIEDNEGAIQKLYDFSKGIAVLLSKNVEKLGTQYISREDYDFFLKENGYTEDPYSYDVRSLITRRNDGSVVFAHRSFWDFFIAIVCFERPGLQVNQSLFENAKSFAIDIYKKYLDGHQYRFIRYYSMPIWKSNFLYERFVDENDLESLLKNAIEELSETADKELQKTIFYKTLTSFCDELLCKQSYLLWYLNYGGDSIYKFHRQVSDHFYLCVWRLFDSIQTYFEANNIDLIECLNDIVRNYDKVDFPKLVMKLHALQNNTLVCSCHYVVLPWLKNKYPNKSVNSNMVVGRCLSEIEDICNLLQECIHNKQIVFLLVDSSELAEVVQFILKLSDELKKYGIGLLEGVIVVINSKHHYMLNGNSVNYDAQQIEKCLKRMDCVELC